MLLGNDIKWNFAKFLERVWECSARFVFRAASICTNKKLKPAEVSVKYCECLNQNISSLFRVIRLSLQYTLSRPNWYTPPGHSVLNPFQHLLTYFSPAAPLRHVVPRLVSGQQQAQRALPTRDLNLSHLDRGAQRVAVRVRGLDGRDKGGLPGGDVLLIGLL